MLEEHTGWMQSDGRHGVHVRLGYVLDHHWDIEIPCSDSLIVGRRHKPPILVDECDGVYRSEMLIVFLRNLARVYVIL